MRNKGLKYKGITLLKEMILQVPFIDQYQDRTSYTFLNIYLLVVQIDWFFVTILLNINEVA